MPFMWAFVHSLLIGKPVNGIIHRCNKIAIRNKQQQKNNIYFHLISRILVCEDIVSSPVSVFVQLRSVQQQQQLQQQK